MPMARSRQLLLLLVTLPALQLSQAATRRRQIEDLSSEVEVVGEGEGVDDKVVDVIEEDAETFNGHGNGEEDFWDHVMENLTDNVTEDASREIKVKEAVDLKEDEKGKSVVIEGGREPSEIPRVLLDECPRLSRHVMFSNIVVRL